MSYVGIITKKQKGVYQIDIFAVTFRDHNPKGMSKLDWFNSNLYLKKAFIYKIKDRNLEKAKKQAQLRVASNIYFKENF